MKGYAQDITPRHSRCAQMRVREATLKVLAQARGLEDLSLTLGSAVKSGLEHFNNHPALRSMSIYFEGFTPLCLPKHLPALSELTIKVGEWSGFFWPQAGLGMFESLEYPRLTKLTINDSGGTCGGQYGGHGSAGHRSMNEGVLFAISEHFPNAIIEVVKVSFVSDLRAYSTPFRVMAGVRV